MNPVQSCPDCGAVWQDKRTCQDNFHQMLFWEHEIPANWAVHHLMVASYHIQHPSLYSPEGLEDAKQLLTAFLVEGCTPDEIRKHNRTQVDSSRRTWKIKGTPDRHGSHPHSVTWTMTTAAVVAGGVDNYCINVKCWAESIHKTLKAAGKS